MSSACPDRHVFSRALALLALYATVTLTAPAAERVLRVAADPNNLPFSNERGEGFENRIAELLAAELGARLEYMWWPQRRGFFRETLGSDRADLTLGVPAGFELVLTTRPYYASSYVFVRRAGTPRVNSFDDPQLLRLRIGIQIAGDDGSNTPAAHALAARGIINNVRGYTLYGNYARPDPPADIIRGVETGEVDVAVAWGPMAGFFAQRSKVPLEIEPVGPCDCPRLQFVFSIAVGVARSRPELRDEIDAILVKRRAAIDAILEEFGVPRVAPLTTGKKGHRHAAR